MTKNKSKVKKTVKVLKIEEQIKELKVLQRKLNKIIEAENKINRLIREYYKAVEKFCDSKETTDMLPETMDLFGHIVITQDDFNYSDFTEELQQAIWDLEAKNELALQQTESY